LRCRPSAQSKGFTHAQYQRFIDALDESIYNLRDMFPDRVVFGRVGEDACALNYHVWGANAGNWNLLAGQQILGSGMAAVMGVQREGVFGIVRANRPYRQPTRAYRPHAAARVPAYALCR
jgi:hypothetical protein